MLPSYKLNQVIHQSLKKAEEKEEKMMQRYLSFLMLSNKRLLGQFYRRSINIKEDQVKLFEDTFVNHSGVMKSYMQMLRKNGYRMKDKVLDCISNIATSSDPKKEMVKCQKFPWINKIVFDEKTKMYTVFSTEGEFSFIPVSDIYKEDVLVIQMLHKKEGKKESNRVYSNGYDPHEPGNLDYACHFATEQFAYRNPSCFAVTTICPHAFSDSYWYHSYNMSENQNYVIDIANGFVMQIDHFHELLEPIVLDSVLGSDISIRVQDVLEDTYYPLRNIVSSSPLKGLAFYKYDYQSSKKREEIRSKIIC